MINRLQICLIASIHLFAVGPIEAQSCSPYEPAVVTLKGTLTADTLAFILKLDGPICIEPDSSSSLYNDPQRGVREIRLAVVGDSLLSGLRRLLGHRVLVTGQLFSAEAGTRHTSILMLLQDLRAAAARDS